MTRKPRKALPTAELARDPDSVVLRRLRERLDEHAHRLPPDLYHQLQKLISQAQDSMPWLRVSGIMLERWAAVREERTVQEERGERKPLDPDTFADAAKRLKGTPAECRFEMVKKDYHAVERARRCRLAASYLPSDDVIHAPYIGDETAALWRDDDTG